MHRTVGPKPARPEYQQSAFRLGIEPRVLGRMEDSRQRAEEKISRLASSGLDLVDFWRACSAVLADAVPHYQAPCRFTVDPAALLMTSHFQQGLPEFPAEWAAAEYAGDDVNRICDVARSPSGISTLHEATDGDPSRSPRWHANMAYSGDQEMIVSLHSRSGQIWGSLGLYREPHRPLFSDRSGPYRAPPDGRLNQ